MVTQARRGGAETGCAVICEYTTWYHLLGVLAYLSSLSEKPAYVVFVRGAFFGKTVDFPFAAAEHLADRVSLCEGMVALKAHLAGIRGSANKVVLVTPQEYPIRLSAELHRNAIRHDVVVTEEGIGSYGGEWQVLRALMRERRAQGRGHAVSGVLAVLAVRLAKVLYFLFRNREHWQLFDRKTLAPRSEVVNAYKAVLKELTVGANKGPALPDPCTIFTSAPLQELGLVDANSFRRIVQAAECVAGGREQLVIKPHPIESPEKYEGYRVIAPGIPLEVVLQAANPGCVQVVGFSSTTLYTANLLFGIKPLRVVAGDCLYAGLSRRQRQIIDNCSRPLD